MARSPRCLMSLLVLVLVLVPLSGSAQQKQPFTVDDLLTLASVRVHDANADGSLLICSVSHRRERLGNDYARYGDPTYIGPGGAEICLVNGESGERTPLYDEPVQTSGFAFNPAGRRFSPWWDPPALERRPQPPSWPCITDCGRKNGLA